jgi:sugar phosphate isomerase/epimerase
MKRTMLYSIREAPLIERLAAALGNGYSGIAIRHDHIAELDEAGVDVGALMADARARGLEHVMIESLNSWYDFTPPRRIALPGLELSLDDLLAASARIGSRDLNVTAILRSPTETTDSLVEKFAAVCDRCARDGVSVHLEFVVGTLVGTLADAWEIVRRADRPNGGILFDTWHFFRTDPDMALLATIPGHRITAIQLDDGQAGMVESVFADAMYHRLPPGDGVFDLTAVIRILDAAGAGALAGPEVLSSAFDHMPLARAAAIVGDAFDRVVSAALDSQFTDPKGA